MRIVALAAACVAALIAAPHVARADAPATLVGVVRDEAGAPAAGVTVIVGGEFAATDDDGRFEVLLPPGKHKIELSADWLEPMVASVRLAAGERREVTYTVRAATEVKGEVIEVVGAERVQAGRQAIDAAQARQVPGSAGDPAMVVRSMPGVARPPPGSADLVVWGAAPRDTRVFVDGVPVPSLYHVGGWRAAVGGE